MLCKHMHVVFCYSQIFWDENDIGRLQVGGFYALFFLVHMQRSSAVYDDKMPKAACLDDVVLTLRIV